MKVFPQNGVLMVKLFCFAGMLAVATGAGVPRDAVAQREVAPQAIDSSWLSADTVSHTATFELIAGLTGLNGALNFNGFRDGELTLTVPLGWTVVMHFRNHDGRSRLRPPSRARPRFGWPRDFPPKGGTTSGSLRIRGGPT